MRIEENLSQYLNCGIESYMRGLNTKRLVTRETCLETERNVSGNMRDMSGSKVDVAECKRDVEECQGNISGVQEGN